MVIFVNKIKLFPKFSFRFVTYILITSGKYGNSKPFMISIMAILPISPKNIKMVSMGKDGLFPQYLFFAFILTSQLDNLATAKFYE